MAELSTTKTWRKTFIDVNINEGPTAQSGQSDGDRQNRQLLWEIKEALITGSGAWTVVRSCGYQSGAWSVGNNDYWNTADDVRWKDSDNTYSWIVLQQAGIDANFRIFIRCSPNKDLVEALYIFISCDSGAWSTDGSSTSDPTYPTNYRVGMYANGTLPWVTADEVEKTANVFQSSDGECTRIYIHWPTNEVRLIMFDKPKLNTALDSSLWIIPAIVLGASQLTYDNNYPDLLHAQADDWAHGWKCGVLTSLGASPACLASECVYNNWIYAEQTNEIGPDYDGNYLCNTLDLVSTLLSHAAVLGRIQDLWLAPSNLPWGDMFRADGSKAFVAIGWVIQQNDGTTGCWVLVILQKYLPNLQSSE